MNVAIRVDASIQIGTGHFMRCLTLADALKKRGVNARFISRHLPDHLRSWLSVSRHEYKLLNSTTNEASSSDLAHAEWLGTSQHIDAQDCIKMLCDKQWDWLVVDHYALDFNWESALRQVANKIFVIDDIADRFHDCDALLDQNYYPDMDTRYITNVPSNCQLLLGPRYALLRNEFKELRNQIKPRTSPISRVLVFFGGVDMDNYTGTVVDILSKIKNIHLFVDVVIGDQHPNREEIEILCKKNGFICHVQTNRMAELMAAADFAIGAAGSATWERCCLGLPTLMVSLADNQILIAKGLDNFGAGKYLGTQDVADCEVMRKAIVELLQDSNLVSELSRKAYGMVDGLGIDRVSDLLIS